MLGAGIETVLKEDIIQTSVLSQSVSVGMRKKCISRNTISLCSRQVVNFAYESPSDENCALVRLKAHEICSIAPFLLFRKNFPVHQVLSVGP